MAVPNALPRLKTNRDKLAANSPEPQCWCADEQPAKATVDPAPQQATVAVARRHFQGPLTDSAAAWEEVDWSPFDVVGVSLGRGARNQATYTERLRGLVRDDEGKPVVITEFGCGAFTGADLRGAGSFQIVSWFAEPPRIRDDHPRSESVQARYLGELIDLYDAKGVHGCFRVHLRHARLSAPGGPEPRPR